MDSLLQLTALKFRSSRKTQYITLALMFCVEGSKRKYYWHVWVVVRECGTQITPGLIIIPDRATRLAKCGSCHNGSAHLPKQLSAAQCFNSVNKGVVLRCNKWIYAVFC